MNIIADSHYISNVSGHISQQLVLGYISDSDIMEKKDPER